MKTYVKPDVFYENFELSQHVATCAWDMSNFKTREECTAKNDDFSTSFVLFANDGCNVKEDQVTVENYCWTNGGSERNVFNS